MNHCVRTNGRASLRTTLFLCLLILFPLAAIFSYFQIFEWQGVLRVATGISSPRLMAVSEDDSRFAVAGYDEVKLVTSGGVVLWRKTPAAGDYPVALEFFEGKLLSITRSGRIQIINQEKGLSIVEHLPVEDAAPPVLRGGYVAESGGEVWLSCQENKVEIVSMATGVRRRYASLPDHQQVEDCLRHSSSIIAFMDEHLTKHIVADIESPDRLLTSIPVDAQTRFANTFDITQAKYPVELKSADFESAICYKFLVRRARRFISKSGSFLRYEEGNDYSTVKIKSLNGGRKYYISAGLDGGVVDEKFSLVDDSIFLLFSDGVVTKWSPPRP